MTSPTTAVDAIGLVSDLGGFESGATTTAGALTLTDQLALSRASGLLQTTLQTLNQYMLGTYPGYTGFASSYSRPVLDKLSDFVSVKDYGAKGDGVTDDTAAIQAAFTANRHVFFPSGNYILSATLTARRNTFIRGEGPENTILSRTGDYGDTIVSGTNTNSFANSAGGFRASGIWFKHGNLYAAGATTLPNLATKGAHIRLYGGSQCLIDNCYFWRLQFNVVFHGGSVNIIEKSTFLGTWDPTSTQLQEGIAGVYLDSTSAWGNPKSIWIDKACFMGTVQNNRAVTYTDGNGNTKSPTITPNCGQQYNILANGGEEIHLINSYVGGGSNANLALNIATTGFAAEVMVQGCFFDGAGVQDIFTDIAVGAPPIYHMTVSHCVFNGEFNTLNAVVVANNNNVASVQDLKVVNNQMAAFIGAPVIIQGATGFNITGNRIADYNCFNVTPATNTDATYGAGIVIGGVSGSTSMGVVEHNTLGGSINGAAQYCWLAVFVQTGLNTVRVGSNMYAGIGSGVQIGLSKGPSVPVTGSSYNASGMETTIVVIPSSAVSINLASTTPDGYEVLIKSLGNSSTWNITIAVTNGGTIEGTSTYVINTDKGKVRLQSYGNGIYFIA